MDNGIQALEIELMPNELDLYKQIPFSKKGVELTDEEIIKGSEASVLLVDSLLKRQAIPEVRLQYFINPLYNIHSKRSHKDIFEMNGTHGEDIVRHPHFWPYLYYWIHGPDLPKKTKQEFITLVRKEEYISGSDIPVFRDFVRTETRKYGLKPKEASEEFYRLALECGIVEHLARMIRDYVRAIK